MLRVTAEKQIRPAVYKHTSLKELSFLSNLPSSLPSTTKETKNPTWDKNARYDFYT